MAQHRGGTYTQYFSYGILWMVPYALLYPHLAYHLGQRFRQHDPRKVTRVLLAVDAVHCGLGMALLGFSVVPSLMFLLVLSFTALVIGGLRLLGMALLVSASSALLVAVLIAPPRWAIPRSRWPRSASCSADCTSASPPSSATSRPAPGPGAPGDRPRAGKAARSRATLAKYLSPQVWEMIFSGKKSVRLETQRKKLTVFFSDIRGFTELSEELEAEALTDLLNNYLNDVEDRPQVRRHHRQVRRRLRHGVLRRPQHPGREEKDAVAAVSMGIAMRKHEGATPAGPGHHQAAGNPHGHQHRLLHGGQLRRRHAHGLPSSAAR